MIGTRVLYTYDDVKMWVATVDGVYTSAFGDTVLSLNYQNHTELEGLRWNDDIVLHISKSDRYVGCTSQGASLYPVTPEQEAELVALSHERTKEKEAAYRRPEPLMKTPGPGYCKKCGSYCWGDCDATGN